MTPEACTINLITALFVATAIHFHPSLIFVGKAGAYQGGALCGKRSSLFLYGKAATITVVGSFIEQAQDPSQDDTEPNVPNYKSQH